MSSFFRHLNNLPNWLNMTSPRWESRRCSDSMEMYTGSFPTRQPSCSFTLCVNAFHLMVQSVSVSLSAHLSLFLLCMPFYLSGPPSLSHHCSVVHPLPSHFIFFFWSPSAALFLSISITLPPLSPLLLSSLPHLFSSLLVTSLSSLSLSLTGHMLMCLQIAHSDRERPLESVPTASGSIVSRTSGTVQVLVWASVSSVCLCIGIYYVCVCGERMMFVFLYILLLYFFKALRNIMWVCVRASVNNAGLLITLNDWWQQGHG